MVFLKKAIRKLKPEYIFDLLVIFSILFSLFIFLQYFGKKETWVVATIKVIPEKWYWGDQSPPNWYALSVKKGDRELDGSGKTLAEITNVEAFDTGGTSKMLYLKTKLAVSYQQKSQKYIYKNKPLELNAPIELSVNNTNIMGVIVQLNNHPQTEISKYLLVSLLIYDKPPWYADAIHEKDKFSLDSDILAEVLTKEAFLHQRTLDKLGFVPYNTVLPIVLDPLSRDIKMKVRIKVRKEGERDWIFRTDQLVKIGNLLNIPLDNNVNLFGAHILAIEEDHGSN